MKLKVYVTRKTIQVNGKEIKIPKLGIKHHALLKGITETPQEAVCLIIDSIYKGLSKAETELVIVHLLAFNNVIPSSNMIGDFEYNINDIYTCNKTEFKISDKVYKFREPRYTELFDDHIDALNKLTLDGVDFNNEPAEVLKWVVPLLDTIAINTPVGVIKGMDNITGV